MSDYTYKSRKSLRSLDNSILKAIVSTPEIMCWFDAQGNLLHYFIDQTDGSPHQLHHLLGLSVGKIFPLSLGLKISEMIVASERNCSTEKMIAEMMIDGRTKIIQLRISPVKYSNQMMMMIQDISDVHHSRERTEFQHKLHSSISKISKEFILLTNHNLNKEIHAALGAVGSLMQVDRSYVFLLKDNGTIMDNVYEWCEKGVESQIDKLRDLPTDIFPWWMEKLNRFENIGISHVKDLPEEASAEREILESQDIKSVAVVPLVYASKLVGFIGFDAVTKERFFPDETMDLLRLLGDSVVNAIERINIDNKLTANEQLFHTVVDNVPVLLWMTQANHNFYFFNQGWLNFTGKTLEEECNESWFQYIHPNEKTDIISIITNAFDQRTSFSIQFRMARHDGVYRWILTNAVPRTSLGGEYLGFIGSCTDITTQKENDYKYRLMSKRIDLSTSFSETHGHFHTIANLLQQYLEIVINLFSFDGGGIYLIDPEHKKAELITSLHLSDEFIATVRALPLDKDPYRTVLVNGLPKYFDSTASKKFGFNAYASIPFYVGKKIGGCINIATIRMNPFTDDDKRIMLSVAEEIGKAVYAHTMEESIRQNKKNVDALFNTINDFLFVLDEQGYVLEVNNVVLRRLGYSLEELRAMHVIQLHVPERREEAQRIVGEMLIGKTKYCPVPLVAKDGTRIEVETNIVLGKWNNQNVIFGVTRDITERKRAERKLFQTEERNRALIESSPDAIVLFDKLENIAFANAESVLLFGYSTDKEMMGLPASTLFETSYVNVWSAISSEIVGKHTVKDVKADLLKRNGKAFSSEICCSAMYDVNGEMEGIIVTIRDITDRLSAEEHLRKSEEENKAIVDAVPDLMFRISRSGIFTDCKVPNIEELYVPPEIFLGKNMKDVLPKTIAEQALNKMEKSFHSKKMEQFEYSLPLGGVTRHFEDRIVALSNDECLSIVRDITSRKNAETKLHQSEQQLQYAFEASNDALWDWNIQTGTLFLSPRWKQMLGSSASEIDNGLNEWKDRIHPSEIDTVLEKVQNNLDGKTEIYISEHRMKRLDGSYVWILDRGKVVERDQLGNPLRMIGTLTDISERVEADLQIKRMSIAIEQSFTSIVITDTSANIQYANPHFWKMSGYSAGELIGKNMRELKSGMTSEKTVQSLWNTIVTGNVWEGELVNKKKNGELYNEFVTISPIKNTLGVVENYIAIQQDITERKRNEAELEWNISLLQMMANSSPLGFLVVDNRDDSILYFNHRFCEIWGITDLEERIKNERLKNNDIIPYCIPILSDPVSFGESCKPLQDPNNSAVVEDEILFINNVTIRRYSTQIRGHHGQYFGRFYIFEDITSQKAVEELLKENERKTSNKLNAAENRIKDMSFYLDKASDAIIVTTLDDEIVYINDSVESMYGWNKDELIDKYFTKIFFDQLIPKNFDIDEIISVSKWEEDYEHKTKGNENIWVHLRATVITDSSTGMKSILYVISNITNSRALQEQALHSQRLDSIGTLASGIAHDMNNILGPFLIGLSYFDRILPDQKSKDINEMLKANVVRGADLIKQILGFSRMNQNDVVVVQLKHIIRDMGKLITETFPKNIVVELTTSKELFPVLANPTQIHQAILNLCVNARDAMTVGGRLEIHAENVVVDTMSISKNIDAKIGPYCCISVSDTGTGIPQSIIKKIFDPFFTTKEVGKGTGLGLFNVVNTIKGHNGFIQLDTEVGKGTRFQLYIPAATSENINNIIEQSGDFPRGNGETILLVDDEIVIRDITKAALEDYNYQILTASNGAEALGMYASHKDRIKVIVMDVMMPHLDGPSTVRAIQTMDEKPGIIMMSGIQTNIKIMSSLGLPDTHFMAKPFTIDVLLKIIQSILHP